MNRSIAIDRALVRLVNAALALSLALAFATAARAQTSTPRVEARRPLNVFFIGNSFISVNDMPGMLAEVGNARGSGPRIRTGSTIILGGNLKDLWGWGWRSMPDRFDYVILQEGTPTLLSRPEQTARYAALFDAVVRASGSRTILLVPWARASQRDTQPAMDRSIRTIAKDLGVAVAPVGLAWRIAQERAPGLTLYLPDQRHPAPIGSYIAACVIYLVITSSGESCPPIPVISASAGDIAVAQYAAVRALRMRPVNKRR